ncbi:MAG: formyl transferase [Candidatus Protistobacter heckmanni]|nr:formyl transferase [Candidatus Protistobacter heckmanni]
MKFAIAASDRYLGVFEALSAAGWQAVKLFTSEVGGRLHRNAAVMQVANRLGIPTQQLRMRAQDLEALAAAGCEALVVASYPWRVPEWRGHLKYAINFHPSPLPEGRGPYPLVNALLEGRRSWGVSCHRIDHDFDAGAVLAAEHFEVDPHATHEDLDLRCQMAARRLAGTVAGGLEALWTHAEPQGAGGYYPHWGKEERSLDFTQPVAELQRKLRAFGLIETCATINKVEIFVRRAEAWREVHAYQSGALAHKDGQRMVVAARDGFVAILEWSPISPDVSAGNIGR